MLRLATCALLLLAAAAVAGLTDVTIVVSSDAGDRLNATKQPLRWMARPAGAGRACPAGAVCLNTTNPRAQIMDGFGGTFNRAGAYVLGNLSKTQQDNLLRDLFDQRDGAAFNLGKFPIAANDFAVPVWYTYEETRGNFTIAFDLAESGGLVPFIKRAAAVAKRNFRLQATMDYAPWWMLNASMQLPAAGVNRSAYNALAQYYLDFVNAVTAQGIPIEFLSMFNEPKESYCYETIDSLHTLLTEYVGPLFRRTRGAPKLTWGEQYGRTITYQNYPALMNKSRTLEFTDVIFYHGYDCEPWECTGPGKLNTTCPGLNDALRNIAAYKRMYSNLSMWMTEVCYAVEFDNYPSNTTKCPKLPRSDFMDGLQWGRMLFGDIGAGAAGWIYWNYILDTAGGPWLTSPEHNNPPNNYQQPLIIVNTTGDAYTLTGCYYFMAHFSKFILPGMRYVPVTRGDGLSVNVYAAAFVNDANGAYVVVAMNDRMDAANVSFVLNGASEVVLELPAASIVTARFGTRGNGPANAPPDPHGRIMGAVLIVGIVAGVSFGALLLVLRSRRRRLMRHSAPEADYAEVRSSTNDLYAK